MEVCRASIHLATIEGLYYCDPLPIDLYPRWTSDMPVAYVNYVLLRLDGVCVRPVFSLWKRPLLH